MNVSSHLDDELIAKLIGDIKNKKELRSLNSNFIRGQLLAYLEREPKVWRFLLQEPSSKSEQYKQLVKELRRSLRRVYGLFRIDEMVEERKKLIEELFAKKTQQWKKFVEKILATHASTKERLSYYEELYGKIFAVTGKPKRLIDLGSGLNPFSVHFMKLRTLEYYAYDISDEELNTLENFFAFFHKKNKQFVGHAETVDLTDGEQLKQLPKADVCFLFKMTDVLDRGRGHKVTEAVLREVPARFVVVSFPTKTMSGKRMNYPQRRWFELLCNRLGWEFTLLDFQNEVFYVVRKGNSNFSVHLPHKPL